MSKSAKNLTTINYNNQQQNMEYSKLDVWIGARKLVNLLYDSTKLFPKEELFGMTNQMRRSVISIPSNIAEGCGRQTSKDTLHFLHM